MAAMRELRLQDFFASRAGVCIYVTVGDQTFRIQFNDLDAAGCVAGELQEYSQRRAEEALAQARAAFRKYRHDLAPLFIQIASSVR